MYSIAKINKIIKGEFLQQASNDVIKHIAIDSRKISFANESLFFALTTSLRDGHQYIEQAYNKGIRNFIVSQKIDVSLFANATIIFVQDVLFALQSIAIFHRNTFTIPTIGITGSNGKTIVKEWLFQLLQYDYNIVRSPKSYNSQIGVALSVWNIKQEHNLAIFEAGISTIKEMGYLQKIIRPTIGILTNIGTAHNEGFENNIEKLKEKLKLFVNSNILIYCNKEEWINKEVEKLALATFTWSTNKNANITIEKIEKEIATTTLHLIYNKKKEQIKLPFTDEASIENSMHCIATMVYLKYNFDTINKLVQYLEPVAMRLEQKKGINNCTLINDSYSNDMQALQIALDYLQQQNASLKKTIILTDIAQTITNKEQTYNQIANLLYEKKIDKLIAIGNDLHKFQKFFTNIKQSFFYTTIEEAINDFEQIKFNNEAILIKGARQFAVEKYAHLLEEKVHQTILEINTDRIIANVKAHQKLLKPTTQIMAIVKAFGYGSGAVEVATILQSLKIDYLAVAYPDEGVALRKAGIHLPIMVMNTDEAAFNTLLEYDLEPELFSQQILQSFLLFAKHHALIDYPVHIKLDTGMHRLGFEENEMEKLCTILQKNNSLKIKTIFSHLVGSEDASLLDFTSRQNSLFVKMCTQLETTLGYTPIKHIANSAAIENYPLLQHQMVRLGIGMYGVTKNNIDLQQVCTLKTTIAQVKNVNANDTVGYNRKGILTKASTIATVRIGYADGYNRKLGNGVGKMLVNGILCPTIGNICMDMTMLDITEVPNFNIDDYVIVFGDALPVTQLALWSNTIPYEILTGISQRVKRIYYGE